MAQLGFHAQQFADKVRAMEQTNKKDLLLTAVEAKNLMHDIFKLQSQIVSLTESKEKDDTITVVFDGSKF